MSSYHLGGLALLLTVVSSFGEPVPKKEMTSAQQVAFMASLLDGSTLRVAVLDEMLEFTTPHGPLRISFHDVKRMELTLRVPEDVRQMIDQAAADLGNGDYRRRQAATIKLFEHGERAIPALQAQTKSADAETVKRAEQLLERLKESIPSDRLPGRPHDLIFTNDSKLAGRLVTTTIRVRTLSFGEQSLSISDIRSLRSAHHPESESLTVLPDPGSLVQFDGQGAKTFAFRVTGQAAGGNVWGTDIYTLDSRLAIAAVHVGALKVGQTGVIKVTLLGPQPTFTGSTRNGVTTIGFGQFGGYRIHSGDDDS